MRLCLFRNIATALPVFAIVIAALTGAGPTPSSAQQSAEAASPELSRPAGDDYTAASLRRYAADLERRYRGYRNVPLDVKAEFFEWHLWRYFLTDDHHVVMRAELPVNVGARPAWYPGADTSTWNGALMSALAYKYAIRKDPETLDRLAELVRGMHHFLSVTGKRGLVARSTSRADGVVLENMQPYTAADGTQYVVLGQPAKGTYNQIAGGYAHLFMHALADLPADVRQMAQDDAAALVAHVIEHDYRLTNADGSRTPYGNLTPIVSSVGVPFNAQVAYLIIALGYSFPPPDPTDQNRVFAEFGKLRNKHHVYYEDPWRSVTRPQRVGASPFVKGMNDRNHVTNAAFVAMELERDHARRNGVPVDREFLYKMGRTMYWSMTVLDGQHNSLCNFMWAGILSDPQVFDAVIKHRHNETRRQVDRLVAGGIEQLRRFRLDRFADGGREIKTRGPRWIDEFRADEYHWKNDANLAWQSNGEANNNAYCAIDYLYAYWLFRYYRLDENAGARRVGI